MEELRVRTRNEELKVKGSLELIQREREAFYQHIKETEEVSAKAEAELVQNMCGLVRHDNMRHDKGTSNADKIGVLRACGELQNTWEDIAAAIKCGVEFKVGDYKHSSMEDGQSFTMVVTDVTNEYVRFESRDCIGKEVAWNKDGKTEHGYAHSDIHKYLNKELFQLLPEDLKNVIDLAERKTLQRGEEESFNALLFLPAASEVFGEDDCYGDEGLYEQMEYYKDRRHRMRGEAEGEDTCDWWLASVRSGNSTTAGSVSGDGNANRLYRVQCVSGSGLLHYQKIIVSLNRRPLCRQFLKERLVYV